MFFDDDFDDVFNLDVESDELDGKSEAQEKSILWFGSSNTIYEKETDYINIKDLFLQRHTSYYNNNIYTDFRPDQSIINVRLTSPLIKWKQFIDYVNKDYVSYVVIVITEPILLLMNDEEYNEAINELINKVISMNINHSLLINNTLYKGESNIFKGNYYNRYLNRLIYKVHQDSYYTAIKSTDFKLTGGLDFSCFFSKYIETLIVLLHDRQEVDYFNYLNLVIESLGDYYNEYEKDFIIRTADLQVFFNTEEAINYYCEKKLLSKYDDFLYLLEGYKNVKSDKELFITENIDGFEERTDRLLRINISETIWKEIEIYIKRYGKNRATNESKKNFEDKLNEKTFQALIECLGIEVTEEEKSRYYDIIKEIIHKWKNNTSLKVVPYEDDSDLYEYLDDFIGESRHVVFNKYILKDRLFADEMEKFMNMFQEYVSSVRKIDIRFEKEQTDRGIIYIIKSYSPNLVRDNFSDFVDEFSELLENIDKDTVEVDMIVKEYDISKECAEDIIHKYDREIKRLKNDIKYSYMERKVKIMRSLEENLVDQQIKIDEQQFLNKKLTSPALVVNIESVVVNDDKRMGTFIEGDYNYGIEDNQLIEIVKKYADNQEELINALHLLKDDGIDIDKRTKAQRMLNRFLQSAAEAVGEVGVNILSGYLQGLINH